MDANDPGTVPAQADGRRRRGRMRTAVIGVLTVGIAAAVALVAPGTAGAAGCSGVALAPAFTAGVGWGVPVQVDAGIAGSFDTFVRYNYSTSGNIGTVVAVQGLGFLNGEAQWFDLPPTGGANTGTVPWGVNLGAPALRAASAGTGTQVGFSCLPTTDPTR